MGFRIGIADTCFARINMYDFAKKAIEDSGESIKIERYTVPGIKDLPLACKRLLETCDIAIALGMPGDKPIDKQCAHEASQGLIQTQLIMDKHILEVFVYLDEASNKKLIEITKNRTYDHTINAIKLLKGPTELSVKAGKGIRQGFESIGPMEE